MIRPPSVLAPQSRLTKSPTSRIVRVESVGHHQLVRHRMRRAIAHPNEHTIKDLRALSIKYVLHTYPREELTEAASKWSRRPCARHGGGKRDAHGALDVLRGRVSVRIEPVLKPRGVKGWDRSSAVVNSASDFVRSAPAPLMSGLGFLNPRSQFFQSLGRDVILPPRQGRVDEYSNVLISDDPVDLVIRDKRVDNVAQLR